MTDGPRIEIRERKNARHYPFVVYDNEEKKIVSVEADRDGAERTVEMCAAFNGD